MDNKFYLKYLKYRSKYLSLKKLTGGANCPKIGYNQHIGECWHDALSIILLYSDELSDHHQVLFDNPSFNARNIVKRDPSTFKKHLMPINIELEDYDLFFNSSEDYINSLYRRYINDKRPISPSIRSIPVSPDMKWTDIVSTPSIIRQDSGDMSLGCVKSIYDISNINNVNPIEYTDTNHGGLVNHNYVTVATVNFFLTSYNTNKYIDMSKIKLYDTITGTIDKVIHNLERIKINIQNCHAIVLELKSDNYTSGHAVACIKCNNKYYFYDNNGINHTSDKLSVEFNWKDELINRIDGIINIFEKYSITEISELLKRLFSTNKFNYLNNIFSDFINGKINILNKINNRPDKIGNIGRKYLYNFHISDMNFLTLKDIPDYIDIEEQLQIVYDEDLLINDYNNKRTLEFIENYVSKVNYDSLFNLFKYSLLSNNSMISDKVFNYIINNNPRGVNAITSDNRNLLFAFITMMDSVDDKNYKNLELKKHYISELINRNIKFTTKNKAGFFFYEIITNDIQLKENEYLLEIIDFIIMQIIYKILRDTPSLAEFYSILNHPFFKKINIDKHKRNLVKKYKSIHKS